MTTKRLLKISVSEFNDCASEGTAAFGVSSTAGAAVAELAPLSEAFMLIARGKTVRVRTDTQTLNCIYKQGRSRLHWYDATVQLCTTTSHEETPLRNIRKILLLAFFC